MNSQKKSRWRSREPQVARLFVFLIYRMHFYIVYTVIEGWQHTKRRAVCQRISFTSRSNFESFIRTHRLLSTIPDVEEVPLSCVMKTYPNDYNKFSTLNWPHPFPAKK